MILSQKCNLAIPLLILTIYPWPEELPTQSVEGGDVLWTDIAVVNGRGRGRLPVMFASTKKVIVHAYLLSRYLNVFKEMNGVSHVTP